MLQMWKHLYNLLFILETIQLMKQQFKGSAITQNSIGDHKQTAEIYPLARSSLLGPIEASEKSCAYKNGLMFYFCSQYHPICYGPT